MTTIVLAVIGIIMAALAALMVIYYGDGAFLNVSNKAQAGRLINEGVQIQAAVSAFAAQEGSEPGMGGGDFIDDLISKDYLTHRPQGLSRGFGTDLPTNWKFDPALGIARSVIGSAENRDALEICTEARKSVGLTGEPKQCSDGSITASDPCCVMPESQAG